MLFHAGMALDSVQLPVAMDGSLTAAPHQRQMKTLGRVFSLLTADRFLALAVRPKAGTTASRLIRRVVSISCVARLKGIWLAFLRGGVARSRRRPAR